MTLYEFLKVTKDDFDTYDTEYDAVVTVGYIADEDEEDNYDRFCNSIIKKVNVIEKSGDGNGLIVDWSKLIYDNIDKFRQFTSEHWKNQYEDDEEEFVYQWINEIHWYLAGYVSEDFYAKLVKFVDSLEYK